MTLSYINSFKPFLCFSFSKNGFSVTKKAIDILSCNTAPQRFFCAALAEHQGNPLLLLPPPVLSSLAAALGAEHLVVALDSGEEEEEGDTETERLAELAKGMHQVEGEKHVMCRTYHSHNRRLVYSSPGVASGTGGYPSSGTTLAKKRSIR